MGVKREAVGDWRLAVGKKRLRACPLPALPRRPGEGYIPTPPSARRGEAGWGALLLLFAANANAASWIDWFATPDQQGRWHFEHGDYKEAAAHFEDPAWKGLSLYRAGDYSNALVEFSRLDSPEGAFLQGNAQARLGNLEAAIKSYDNALKVRPAFPEAIANRKLVASLIPKQSDEPPPEAPDLDPDDIKFDDKGKQGKKKQMDAAQLRKLTADQWMKNLQVSPSEFLRQKFHIEAEEKQP